jgi:hypothetical protein
MFFTMAAMKEESSSQQQQHHHLSMIVWYLIFGAIHELSHVIVLLWTVARDEEDDWSDVMIAFTSIETWFGILLGRQTQWTLSSPSSNHHHRPPRMMMNPVVRHVGWMVSVGLALWTIYIQYYRRGRTNNTNNQKKCSTTTTQVATAAISDSPIVWAATITALEAIWTDLLAWPVISALLWIPTIATQTESSSFHQCCLYCGNFGIILLHDAWFRRNNNAAALDVLERMVGTCF